MKASSPGILWFCLAPVLAWAQSAGPDADTSSRAGTGPAAAARDSALEIQEKSATSRSTRVHREKEISRIRLSREELGKVAAAQGDPFKAIGTLPGISGQSDLSVRPFVRGGKAEETQVIWEGIPLLQPYHFGSAYSVFNIESLRDLTFHGGGFPVEQGNALSGAIFMRARPAPMDTLALSADLSLLRGNAYAGVPLVRNRLGIAFSYQAFWYDWVVNRGLDIAGLFPQSSKFRRDKRQFQSYFDLPNFKDLQTGAAWRISDGLTAEYTGLWSRDIFTLREPGTRYLVNGGEVSPDYYDWNLFYRKDLDERERVRMADTLAGVSVDNAFHGLALGWRPKDSWSVRQTVAYQAQTWGVGFFDGKAWIDSIGPDDRFRGRRVFGPSDYRLDIRNRAFDWRLDAESFAVENLALRAGASLSFRSNEFAAKLPRVVFEAIVNGNTDVLEALGHIDPDGFTIRKKDPGADSTIDYLYELPRRIRADESGRLSDQSAAAYLSGEYEFDPRNRLSLGVRAENDSYAGRLFISPRIAYFRTLGPRDELTLASGLYSQGDFPFQVRAVNPSLESEKAFHANLEWTHAFSPRYRLECQAYQKNYFDLAVPYMIPTGRLEYGSGPLANQDSTVIQALPKDRYDSVVERFGTLRPAYRTGGRGKAGGAEVSFRYDPNADWGGWFSAEAGYSKRQDAPGGPVYDFRYGRPWAFNWVNHFKLPNRFGLSIRGRWAAGLPYTDYVAYGPMSEEIAGGFAMPRPDPPSDTLFHAGPRNGARYSPYSRWDFRLSRTIPVRRHRLESYFEIWNAFNSPNFLLRDARTRQWKFADFNYPFPILFLGISGRW